MKAFIDGLSMKEIQKLLSINSSMIDIVNNNEKGIEVIKYIHEICNKEVFFKLLQSVSVDKDTAFHIAIRDKKGYFLNFVRGNLENVQIDKLFKLKNIFGETPLSLVYVS